MSLFKTRFKGCCALVLAILNILIMSVPFFSIVLVKLLLPVMAVRKSCTRILMIIAKQYNLNNALIFLLMSHLHWKVTGDTRLNNTGHYFVSANHQSWADILVLQYVLERKIPLLKFFIKQQLIWMPVLGAAWWALDFPFMKRYSREYLDQHPEKKGMDLLETQRKCERFKYTPVSIMSFLEGTRFSEAKRVEQGSPFQYLLIPKAGGAGLVISSMGSQLKTLLDVTIDYQVNGDMTIWKLFSGQVQLIHVNIRKLDIPEYFFGRNYEQDELFRKEIRDWINQIWVEKDQYIEHERIARKGIK